jgi:hypothetical protein
LKTKIDLFNRFNPEDRAKVEAVHRGLKSRSYTPGRLAPSDYEGTIWDFYQFMAGRFTDDA